MVQWISGPLNIKQHGVDFFHQYSFLDSHLFFTFCCLWPPYFSSNKQRRQKDNLFSVALDQTEKELCAHISRGLHPLRTEISVFRSHVFPHLCFWRLTYIKGSFSTVILWRMVGFWVYTMEWPSKTRFDLLNRIREKRNILGYPENQPQFDFQLVYNSKSK